MVFVWGVVRYVLSYTTRDECRVSIRFDSMRWGVCVFGHSVYNDIMIYIVV
jgi:hypothetical protein